MLNLAIAVLRSDNIKTGPVSATYASQASCPLTCPWYKCGCYGELDMVGIHARRLASDTATPIEVAFAEAAEIRALPNHGQAMRLHVVGDCPTDTCADVVSEAVKRWQRRFTAEVSKVWTYTHAWRKVARRSWRTVSVLASCETLADCKAAMARGYAAAVVVGEFKAKTAWMEDGVKVIPCPAQTRDDVQCVDCQLCWKDSWLRASGAVIGFEPHGSGAGKVRAKLAELVQIQGVRA